MNQTTLERLQYDRVEGACGEMYFSQITVGRCPISKVLQGCHLCNERDDRGAARASPRGV